MPTITEASVVRIETFVDWFIRTDYVSAWTSDKDSDFINEPDRAARCYDAAEHGADGKTHAEVIEDWREAFKAWIRERRRGKDSADPDRFTNAVEKYFDDLEAWHEKAGSLHKEIG